MVRNYKKDKLNLKQAPLNKQTNNSKNQYNLRQKKNNKIENINKSKPHHLKMLIEL